MKKNLQIINQNNKLMLKKSKSLMSITNSILSKDDWIQRLWDWADDNNVPDLEWFEDEDLDSEGYWVGLERDREKLLSSTILDISSLRLIELPTEIGNLINLEALYLHENQLLEFPKEILNLSGLTNLCLSKNILYDVPKEIGNLTNLTELWLGDIQLSELPKEIGNLSNLSILVLTKNKLFELPEEIGKLTSLTELWLSTNELSELAKEIWNLKNLTNLSLSKNKLFDLPEEIGNLTSLTKLWLGNNQLSELPKEIGNLINLQELYLQANDLVELPIEIVNLTHLTELDFEDNPNLILTEEQKEWIHELINNGCDVVTNDKYQKLSSAEYELERRYKYLDEFNIGREVPITEEMLNTEISSSIKKKLTEDEVTFEKFLDEASEYLDREKFNTLVQKLYDRSYDLGTSFERNISFVSYVDNKLTWTSTAFGEDKKLLITHWGVINMFVKDTFGFETKIINIAVSVE